jgi:hypothetical protein
MSVTEQNNGYTYEELPKEITPELILKLRGEILEIFTDKRTLHTFNEFRRKKPSGGSFCFRDHTVAALTTYFQEDYPIETKRLVMLVILGHDALPQGDAPRWHNMGHYVPSGTKKALKDELMEFFQDKFPGVICTYPIIAHPKPNRTNYGLIVHYGNEAVKRRKEIEVRKAEKAARRAEALAAVAEEETSAPALAVAEEETSAPALAVAEEETSAPAPAPALSDLAALDFADKKGRDLEAYVAAWVFKFAVYNKYPFDKAAELTRLVIKQLAADLVDNREKRLLSTDE